MSEPETGMVAIEPQQPTGLQSPKEIVDYAADAANRLRDIVEKQGLFSMISGKKHLSAEAWLTVIALDNAQALDDYVYQVAGCVGEFWTAVSMSHTPSLRHWDGDEMSRMGVRFGKALQMTNVLRDVPRDLRIGRCYLPQSDLDELGLSPSDLLEAALSPTARPALVRGIETALEHYRRAEEYIVALPGRNMRLRLATLWPVLIGLATLGMVAREESWLDPGRTSRVSRKWVYRMMATSLLRVHSNSAIRRWIGRLRSDVQRAL